MKRQVLLLAACALIAAAAPGPRDPDWPCQQIKVAHLSLWRSLRSLRRCAGQRNEGAAHVRGSGRRDDL